MINTKYCLPPEIIQYYDRRLLTGTAFFCDSLKDVWLIYEYVRVKLWHKAKEGTKRKEKIKHEERIFLEVYGKAKAKKEEVEKASGKPFERPFDYFDTSEFRHPKLFKKIKRKARML